MPNVGDLKIKDGRLYRFNGFNPEGKPQADDLGEAQPIATDAKDRIVQFELNGKLHRVGAWAPDGAIRDFAEENRPKDADKPKRGAGDVAKDVAVGAAKSAGQTVSTIAKGINAIPGVGETLSPSAGIRELDKRTKLENTAQEVGAVGEQLGEMYLTGGPVRKGIASITTKAIPLLEKAPALLRQTPKVVNMASEAANAGGNAILHDQDAGTAAAFGAGGALTSEVLTAAGPTLKKGAREQYNRVLAATTDKNKAKAAETVPELIKRGVVGNEEQIGKMAGENVRKLGGQIDEAVSRVPEAARVDATKAIDDLENLKQTFIVEGQSVDDAAVKNIEELQGVLNGVIGDKPFGGVSYKSLNRVRQIWDGAAARGGAYTGKTLAEGSMLDAKAAGASAIREELSKAQPDIAKINAEFSFWKKVDDVMQATEKRRVGQAGGLRKVFSPSVAATVGLGSAARGTPMLESGAYAAASLAVLSGLDMLLKSGRYNTLSAVAKDRIANAIMSGNAEKVADLLGRTGAAVSGVKAKGIGSITNP